METIGKPADLIDSDDFGWIDGMEFLSRSQSRDLYAGRHRSSQLGGCTEFADHRPYHPGDSLRQMDWRLLAKRDRHYIKRYEDERTVSTLLIIDRSGSMNLANKYHHALRSAACLARLLLGGRDPVGLASWDAKGDGLIVQPRSVPSHFEALFETITTIKPEGETHLPELVQRIIPLFPKKMRMVIFTDAFVSEKQYSEILQNLSIRGHELILGHVLAPEEVDFEFDHTMRFVDLEGKNGEDFLDINPAVYRDAYLERFGAFLDDLVGQCGKHGCGYMRLVSNQSAGAVLAAFLRRWNSGSLAPVLGADQLKSKLG